MCFFRIFGWSVLHSLQEPWKKLWLFTYRSHFAVIYGAQITATEVSGNENGVLLPIILILTTHSFLVQSNYIDIHLSSHLCTSHQLQVETARYLHQEHWQSPVDSLCLLSHNGSEIEDYTFRCFAWLQRHIHPPPWPVHLLELVGGPEHRGLWLFLLELSSHQE